MSHEDEVTSPSTSKGLNMALRAIDDWSEWLSFLPASEEVITSYAKSLVDADMTEEDLSELSHELLIEMKISKPGHRTKILKKAKCSEVKSTKVMKSDIKLPTLTKNISPSGFRKFVIDWKIYKSEHQIFGSKCNKLLYSSCDNALQSSIINGLHNFLETTEDVLLEYIKNAATQESNPTVYRLEFQKFDQTDGQNIDSYVDILREKAVDCEFICPMKCKLDYSEYAIRDRFIQGIQNKKLQTNILTNISKLPKLSDVIKHAKSIETANISVWLKCMKLKLSVWLKKKQSYLKRRVAYTQLEHPAIRRQQNLITIQINKEDVVLVAGSKIIWTIVHGKKNAQHGARSVESVA